MFRINKLILTFFLFQVSESLAITMAVNLSTGKFLPVYMDEIKSRN